MTVPDPHLDSGAECPPAPSPLRQRLWRIIFLSDTPAGRAFDLALLGLIGLSVATVMLESVASIHARWGNELRMLEWVFTAVFTLELIVRLWVVRSPVRYLTSFFGIVDIASVLPSYVSLFVPGGQALLVVRVLRMLRMFRVLKMAHHVSEASVIINALLASRRKILVFFSTVLAVVCVEGTLVYVVESPYNPAYSNIPQSIYWAIVTITTVGYGDIAPVTILGKILASMIMLTGFAILAVPTGFVTAELTREMRASGSDNRRCNECGWHGHDPRARFCHQCGTSLSDETASQLRT